MGLRCVDGLHRLSRPECRPRRRRPGGDPPPPAQCRDVGRARQLVVRPPQGPDRSSCLVVCVAASRVYRGDHHPTDALAGAVLGAGALWVAAMTITVWRSHAAVEGSPA
ncbi:MAG TPA: phosphatase PAP2 family protein [Acidimicrobiales bacterium]|nr:phosphatase PAP2 family protein [Acidimicrobiales bacterium]